MKKQAPWSLVLELREPIWCLETFPQPYRYAETAACYPYRFASQVCCASTFVRLSLSLSCFFLFCCWGLVGFFLHYFRTEPLFVQGLYSTSGVTVHDQGQG